MAEHGTWLSGYMRAFRAAYGEAPTQQAVKRMARTFKELEADFPREEVEARFRRYCVETTMRFYSVERFAVTFPNWKERRSVARDNYLQPKDVA